MTPENISVSTENEIKFIENSLNIFNEKNGPFPTGEMPKPLNFVMKDSEDKIIAGINAIFYRFIAYVDVLWVDDFYRGKGLGKTLYQKVEKEAQKLGAKLIHLETLEFQAKDFYIKLGFEVYGILENFPPGHTKYSLKKNL
ncbi:MAG TPA: GNAT family N-acetyltransferase [Hanamia sp.]